MAIRLHPDTHIGLVTLKVSSLQKSLAFYRDVVGLQILQEQQSYADLTADGVQPLVRLVEVPEAVVLPRRAAAGLYHFALLLPDRHSLGLSLRHLIESGIHIGHSDHLVSEALYITDPDNNGIEIYADRARELWQRDEHGEYIMGLDPIDKEGLLAEVGSTEWNGLPPETIIGHIHLHVSNLAKSRDFYTEVLGFDSTAHMDQSAWFVSAGGYHHHIGMNTWAGVGTPLAPPKAAGLAHYAIVLPNEQDVQFIRERLSAANIPFQTAAKQLIVHDPSGIEIHLQAAP
ncbi:VOC family protein [Brevibacillus choshinensis]|uniref:VOC family protein n=1 Tax=Brevibacillus choshinensis TaxID=54911 RepID=UPI002E1DC37F|nr:VOC family protein [Brevibacillus choshinensis]